MSQHVRYEKSDVNVRAILGVGAGLATVTAVMAGLVWLLVLFLARSGADTSPREFPLAASYEQRLPPEPRLQTNPREDLQTLRQAEERLLRTYGWVDRDSGIVRIPIDEAIRLTLERGLPSRAPEGRKP
jgi:hypothetical protein